MWWLALTSLFGVVVVSAGLAGPDEVQRLGAHDYETYESTPVVYHSRQVLMETITLAYPRHISHWFPQYKNCSSYFRFRDMESGFIIRNLTESCDYSFGSAFVDKLANGTEVFWVFGTSWFRPASGFQSTASSTGENVGWQGKCASDLTCEVGAFWSHDPTLQTWWSGIAMLPGHQSFNVDVARGSGDKGNKFF